MEALNEFYCCFLNIFVSSVSCQCSIHLQAAERSPESSSTEAKRQNVEIDASGKLNLLGRMLEEINKQSLKALLLYEASTQYTDQVLFLSSLLFSFAL